MIRLTYKSLIVCFLALALLVSLLALSPRSDVLGQTSLSKPTNLLSNGHSPSSSSMQAIVKWDAVSGADKYEYRYGKACTSRSDGVCFPFPNSWTNPQEVSSGTFVKLSSGLASETLYRFEVRSVKGSAKSGWSDFSLFFPTASQPTGTDSSPPTVASIPLYAYEPSHEYTYKVCQRTFPSGTANAWMKDVQDGVDVWEEEVLWTTKSSNIIRSTGSRSDSCTAYGANNHPALGEISRAAHERGYEVACPTARPNPDAVACAKIRIPASSTQTPHRFTSDASITIRRKTESYWNPGGGGSGSCSLLFEVIMYETGHAFGLDHATITDSVMRDAVGSTRRCTPSSYDTAAIMAIYQSHEEED